LRGLLKWQNLKLAAIPNSSRARAASSPPPSRARVPDVSVQEAAFVFNIVSYHVNYLHLDSHTRVPILQEREVQEFAILLKKAILFLCSECSECSPVFSAPSYVPQSTIFVLTRTITRQNLFQLQNNMHPWRSPTHLPKLSTLEESLISLHCTVLKIFRLKGGNFGYSGNYVAVTQDVGLFVSKIPRQMSRTHLSIAMPFHAVSSDEAPKSLWVSSSKIRRWLSFLVQTILLYSHITVDEDTMATITECGDTFQHLLQVMKITVILLINVFKVR
jgi:hypothetical protein